MIGTKKSGSTVPYPYEEGLTVECTYKRWIIMTDWRFVKQKALE
jgi:hypothetical protein